MRVWLDDLRDPKDPYIQARYGARGDEVWVKSVAEAITLLAAGDVESISLDNDLGEGLPEGYKVANWIEENAYLGQLEEMDVNVHSDNTVRKADMWRAIHNAERYWIGNR